MKTKADDEPSVAFRGSLLALFFGILDEPLAAELGEHLTAHERDLRAPGMLAELRRTIERRRAGLED